MDVKIHVKRLCYILLIEYCLLKEMKILLTTLDGSLYPVEVSSDLEIINLKALCEQETGISANRMSLTYNGQTMNDDNKNLASYSISENDIIMVQAKAQTQPNLSNSIPLIDFGSISVPQTSSSSSSSSRPHSSRNQQAPSM